MKIGIMSMQRILNYGSILQAYSLKRIVESLGYDVEFVDYSIEPNIYERNSVYSKLRYIPKNFIRKYLNGNIFMEKIKKCLQEDYEHRRDFISFYPKMGLDYKYKVKSKVDILIIGSDEVFNCLQKGNTVGYSLELFGKNNKAQRIITYAASFGSTTIEGLEKYNVIDEIKTCLMKIDDFSLRDENSVKIVKSLTSRNVKVHLDPVLIGDIEKEKWNECNIDNYILLYGYYKRFTEEECEQIMKFAHQRHLKVIALGEKQNRYDEYISCRPDELIGFFKNAEYIITDTFHGTIFSIITHKRFLTIPRKSIDGTGGNEEKINSLLKVFGLKKRICYNCSNIEEIIDSQIDYIMIDLIRKHEKEKTINYLKSNFEL